MGSKRQRKRIWPAAAVVAVSVLLHLALLLIPLPATRHAAPQPESSNPRISLVEPPPRPRPAVDTPLPSQPPDPVRETPAAVDPPPPQEAAAEDSPPGSGRGAGDDASTAAGGSTEAAPEAIRAQLLGVARTLGREVEHPGNGRGLDYRSVPELPSPAGWLHRHTGRVDPSTDRWRGNDGSRNTRIVTGSGQVACVGTRAPTIDEVFNPWMSAVVPMVHRCGRQRPRAPERHDPWLRRPRTDRE